MRNIPSVPPSPSAAADAVDVKAVSYLRALRIVGERSLLPLVFPRHRPAADEEPLAASAAAPAEERRRGTERRRFSRRIRNKSANLYDTRASEERRRGNRRDSDITTKIQEKI
ncbi:MAG: hypothetical protein C3F18_11860 [Nitrosomonadales bacterium]|nr:MAG: hypothetical protein C3F18_11860 [Nitrosomonadales bacterium]